MFYVGAPAGANAAPPFCDNAKSTAAFAPAGAPTGTVAIRRGCRSCGSCELGGSDRHGARFTAAFAPAGAPT